MLERLNSAISTLQQEETTLLERKSELDQRASELDDALKRVRGALTALGVSSTGKLNGKRGTTKPSPVKTVVREAVVAVLQTSALQANELRAEVERRLRERGYSRMGLSLRLKEVLSADEFEETPAGYQLAALHTTPRTEAVPVFPERVAESA
ncbi:hypothetical protein [Aeoliella sp.]|uniref:hypothetical protein n=1 Tax=Aeoliella sp. TaxID=2795800 RepID=UPI003CCB8DCF